MPPTDLPTWVSDIVPATQVGWWCPVAMIYNDLLYHKRAVEFNARQSDIDIN